MEKTNSMSANEVIVLIVFAAGVLIYLYMRMRFKQVERGGSVDYTGDGSVGNIQYQVEGLMQAVNKLNHILGNPQRRGLWGEYMLEDILKSYNFKSGRDYLVKETIVTKDGSVLVPDVTILLPDGYRVFMDSKFPLENYMRYLDTEDEDSRRRYLNGFLSDVKAKILEVGKYVGAVDKTIDCAVLFIPNDGVYTFMMDNDRNGKLIESATSSKVIICSPLTVYGVISIIKRGMDIFMIDKHASDIVRGIMEFDKEMRLFMDDFRKLEDSIIKLQKECNEVYMKFAMKVNDVLNNIRAIDSGNKIMKSGG